MLVLHQVAVLAIAFLAFLAMLALRLMRRGAARFWAAPAFVALALLPVVVAAGLTTLGFREALSGLALTGSGGVAAIAAGSAEALLPLCVGLVALAGLAFVGLLLTAIGTARVTPGGSGGGPLGTLVALVSVLLGAGLVVPVARLAEAVNQEPRDPQGLLLRTNLCLGGSAALALLLPVLVLVTALRAPRGASPLGVKLASLFALAVSGLMALAGVWFVYGDVRTLTATAMTGQRPDAWPNPTTPGLGEAPSPPEAPPPPPPPPGTGPSSSAEAEQGVEHGSEPVRVGAGIKQPRKLRNVPPVYPEIARQARVQGVVILECTISPEGRVSRVKVLRGIPLLDDAAVDAVKQWVYTPTLLNGVPVSVIMTVTVNFRLS